MVLVRMTRKWMMVVSIQKKQQSANQPTLADIPIMTCYCYGKLAHFNFLVVADRFSSTTIEHYKKHQTSIEQNHEGT